MKRLIHFIVTNYKFKIWQLVLFYFESRKIRGSCDDSDEFQSAYYSRSSGSVLGEMLISCLVEKITPTWILYKQDFSGILLLAITPPPLQSPAPLSLTFTVAALSFTIANRRMWQTAPTSAFLQPWSTLNVHLRLCIWMILADIQHTTNK